MFPGLSICGDLASLYPSSTASESEQRDFQRFRSIVASANESSLYFLMCVFAHQERALTRQPE